jgi:DNA methylase
MMLARAACENLPIAADSIDMIFTDPPYLREYLPAYRWLAQEAIRVLKRGGFVLAMCGGAYLNQIFRMFDAAGLTYYWNYQLEMVAQATGVVWPNGNQHVNISTRTKPILAYSKGEAYSRTCTVGQYRSGGADKRYHSWGQDTDSARYFTDCFTQPGALVLDPFIGGGTTAIACGLIGRRCLACDLDPAALATTQARLANADILHNLPLFAQAEP